VLHGCAGVFWITSSQMLLHDIVGARELKSAVRLNATARYLGVLVGPGVGSAMLLWLGPTVGIFLNTIFYLPLIVWLIFVAGGLAFVIGGWRTSRGLIALRDAPIQRMIAVIVKERTDVSGGENSTSTSYYATLQTEDGRRIEYKVSGALAGRVVVDDIGIAYVKETVVDFGFTQIPTRSLVEFIPIPV